jgi:hypothetical protein
MNLTVGDFIKTTLSRFPSLIVQNSNKDLLLVTVHEYNGDYAWVNKEDLTLLSLNPEEELYIVVNYGNWFREYHENLFQEILLKNIKK